MVGVQQTWGRALAGVVTAGLVLATVVVAAGPAAATFPGRNGQIAYADGDIRVVNPDGSGRARLLRDGHEPAWSPDGRRIAFTRSASGQPWSGDTDVWVANADGTGQRNVTSRAAGDDRSPAWSPDGTRLVFVSDRRGAEQPLSLYVVNADGSGVRRLATGQHDAYDPAWSPRGDRIAFARADGLHTIRPDGTGLTRLTRQDPRTSTGDHDPDWSPDGRRLAFVRGGSACSLHVRTIDADGGRDRSLYDQGCNAVAPSWSPDGTRVAFTLDWLTVGRDGGIYTVRADGSGARRLSPDEAYHTSWQRRPAPVDPAIQAACPVGGVPLSALLDAAGNTHEGAIHCLAWWGVASGVDAHTYAPGRAVNRAQMATFVAQAIERAGVDLPDPGTDQFDDIASSVHRRRINQLAAAGIVHGRSGSSFAPAATVTRGQMTTFLVGAYEHVSGARLAAAPTTFADIAGHTHQASIEKATAAGFATGRTATTFAPNAPVQRDQMGSFLARMLARLVTEGHATLPG